VVVVGPAAMRVLAVSDLHVDYVKNLEWCKSLSDEEYAEDCLIVAGDISHKLDKLEETLRTLKQKFKEVFFTPGNHDLWVTDAKGAKDSIEKMKEVEELCGRLNVATRAKKITFGNECNSVWVVPIYSWYHASWDREEDWVGIPPATKVMADFRACKWPLPIDAMSEDDSLAKLFDSFNSPALENLETVLEIERESAFETASPVITFSHFVPRNELIPEKSKLFYKNLPKAVGSDYLFDRIKQLRPDVHVFGHTHFSWDCWLDDVRYVQWPLGYPKEQERRRKYGTKREGGWKPIVVYDHDGITKCKRTYWCNHYNLSTHNPKAAYTKASCIVKS